MASTVFGVAIAQERSGNGRAECSDRRSGRNGRALYRWSAGCDCADATQSARASASAIVPIASTSTASCSPKINVDVIGSKPSGSPKGLGRSPTIAFPGAVKMFTLSVFDAVTRVGSSAHSCCPFGTPFESEQGTVQGKIGRSATTNPLDEGIDPYQGIGWTLRSGTGVVVSQRAPLDLLWAEMPGRRRRAAIPFAGSQRSSSLKNGVSVTSPLGALRERW